MIAPPESWFRLVDRIAGGRHAAHRIPEAARTDPLVRRSFRQVGLLLALLLLIGGGAVAEAVTQVRGGGHVSGLVWWRLVVIFGIATTLFYFLWRARLGWWWAYSRLSLFSIVFPVIAVATCLVPGLYPTWMVVEQLAFSTVLLVVRWVLTRPHLRQAYARPGR